MKAGALGRGGPHITLATLGTMTFGRQNTEAEAHNLLNRVCDSHLSEVLWREDVGMLAYSPLAFGYLTGKYRSGVPARSRVGELANFGARNWPRTSMPSRPLLIAKRWRRSTRSTCATPIRRRDEIGDCPRLQGTVPNYAPVTPRRAAPWPRGSAG